MEQLEVSPDIAVIVNPSRGGVGNLKNIWIIQISLKCVN
jgi:hypothetical protein